MPAWITRMALLAALGSAGMAAASPFRPLPDEAARPPKPAGAADPKSLPYAQGRQFATLDEYLAFRRSRGAIDLPWYKEVSPGLYELQTTRKPAPAPRRFTRAELARTFGFDR